LSRAKLAPSYPILANYLLELWIMAWMEIGQALAGGIFLSFLPLRLYELYRLPIKVRDDGSGRTKLVSDVQANTLHVKNMNLTNWCIR